MPTSRSTPELLPTAELLTDSLPAKAESPFFTARDDRQHTARSTTDLSPYRQANAASTLTP
jgi:hypothetical protein